MISLRLALTVLKRPDLWAEAVRTILAVSPRRWWAKRPFVPVPDPAYTNWRLATAHGDSGSSLSSAELVSYLEWRRRQHRPMGRV